MRVRWGVSLLGGGQDQAQGGELESLGWLGRAGQPQHSDGRSLSHLNQQFIQECFQTVPVYLVNKEVKGILNNATKIYSKITDAYPRKGFKRSLPNKRKEPAVYPSLTKILGFDCLDDETI